MARNLGDGVPPASAPSSTSHASSRRSANIQRLIDSADQSLSLLASLDDWAGESNTAPPSSSTSSATRSSVPPSSIASSYSQAPMSTESFYFTTPPVSRHTLDGGHEDEKEGESLQVVDLAVEQGFLHVKGVFPDHSVEYVDIEPRFTTIGELKRALCEKRNAAKDLALPSQHARVTFNGQFVQDDWLVIDCGLGIDGVIHIVKALPATSLLGDTHTWRLPTHSSDPRLTVPSIASSYAQQQDAAQPRRRGDDDLDDDAMADEFSHSLALHSTSMSEQFSLTVRPEEAKFAEMISDFHQTLDQIQDTDAFGERLLRGYIEVLQSRLEALEAAMEGTSRVATQQRQRLLDMIQELRNERNTWRLLFELRRICHQTGEQDALMEMDQNDVELQFDMLEDDAVRILESRNEGYKVQKAVKTWLEHIAMERTFAFNEKRGVAKQGGSRTLKLMKKGLLESNEIAMDPDAVLRKGDRHVIEDDAEDEAELLQGVWRYVRAGSLQDAVDLCVRMGEPWRAASLSGGLPVGASEIDDDRALERWGNPMRALWKTTCWKFAEEKKFSLSKRNSLISRQYEEVIYGALSGNAKVLTQSALCENWEDHCWAFLHAMTEQQIDEILQKLLKLKLQSSQLIVGNSPHYLRLYESLLEKTQYLKRYQLNLDTLFDELRNSKIEAVRNQANEPHRRIQAKLVTARIQYVITNILDALLFGTDTTEDDYNWDLHLQARVHTDDVSPFLLRFATHFVLFAGFTGEEFDEEAGHMIVKAYIRHLVKRGQLKLVPVYASRLPVDGAIEIYVQVLASVDDRAQRELLLKRIMEYSDMSVLTAVVTTAVERMCSEYRRQATATAQRQADMTSRVDRKRMRTIGLLSVYSEHRAEALHRTNLLAREFVLENKFQAVRELFIEHIPDDSMGIINLHRASQTHPDKLIDFVIREHLAWKAYIRASTYYDLWRSCTSGAKHTVWTTYVEEKDFLAELMYHVARCTSALVDALNFENGWMLHCRPVSDQSLHKEDAAIRARSLPPLVFNLHFVQLESAKLVMRLRFYPNDAKYQLAHPMLEKSLQVADIVADEHYAVSDALSQDQCRELLDRLRDSAIALLHVDASAPSPEDSSASNQQDDESKNESDA